MNLNQVRVFAAICATGSITAASKRLRVSQPAVSKQLADLEETLGVRLLQRSPRGVILTPAGQALARHAADIFAAERAAETELAELRGLKKGAIAVGASTTIGSYLLPPVLARFAERHPALRVQVHIDNTHKVQAMVGAGELDLGLTEGLPVHDALDTHVFAQDEMVLIAAPSHPLAGHRSIALSRLRQERLIHREQGSGSREVVEAALAKQGLDLLPAFTLGATEGLKNAAAAGLGVAFVSRLSVGLELAVEHLVALDVAKLRIRRDLHRCHRKGHHLSDAERAFVDVLQDEISAQGLACP